MYPDFKQIRDVLDKVELAYKEEIEKLTKQLHIAPLQPIKPIVLKDLSVGKNSSNSWVLPLHKVIIRCPSGHEIARGILGINSAWGFVEIGYTEERLLWLKEKIKQIYDLDKPIHEENILAYNSNKQTSDSIISLLETLNFPSKKWMNIGKGRKSKYDWVPTVWREELSSYVKNYDPLILDKKLDYYNNWIDTEIKSIKEEKVKKEQEAAKKQKQVEETRKLALCLDKLGLDITGNWNDVMDAVLLKNKYLFLAHYLQENRNDWNDGSSYAEYGLSNFRAETEEDKKIEEEISSLIENWEHDGRVFRDCTYSYDYLFGLVPGDLMAEYNDVYPYYQANKY